MYGHEDKRPCRCYKVKESPKLYCAAVSDIKDKLRSKNPAEHTSEYRKQQQNIYRCLHDTHCLILPFEKRLVPFIVRL